MGVASFQSLVESEFGFLADRGFHVETESDESVTFQDDRGNFVRVVHDPRDKAVDIRVGSVEHPRDAVTMGEIMRLEDATGPRHGYPDIDDTLHYLVARAAYKLRNYGQRALSGHVRVFEDAKRLRKTR
jgi:hypothetical protein